MRISRSHLRTASALAALIVIAALGVSLRRTSPPEAAAPAAPGPKPAPRLTFGVQIRHEADKTPAALIQLNRAIGLRPETAWRLVDIDPDRPEAVAIRDAPEEVGREVRIAPGGEVIAWVDGDQRGGELWCRDAGGISRKLMVAEEDQSLSAIAFSPDATRLVVAISAYNSEMNRYRSESRILGVDGSGSATVPLHDSESARDWSPDGRWLLVGSHASTAEGGCARGLRLVGTDGTEGPVLAPGRLVGGARYSPDGRTIAFSGRFDSPKSAGFWLVGSDGSGLKRINEFRDLGGSEICWSPDGRRIALRVTRYTKVRRIGDTGPGITVLGGGEDRDHGCRWPQPTLGELPIAELRQSRQPELAVRNTLGRNE